MSWIAKCWRQVMAAAVFYLRIYYDPSLYRDIAFRETGYGFKRLFILLAVLMLPSAVLLTMHVQETYRLDWRSKIDKLPMLHVAHRQLKIFEQSIETTRLVNPQNFLWLSDEKIYQYGRVATPQLFILGHQYLWVNLGSVNYFGYFFPMPNHYIPLFSWAACKDVVNGSMIVHWINNGYLLQFILVFTLAAFYLNCFLMFMFIRTFGYIARRMVLMALKDTLEYQQACRLLSVSMFPPLTLLAIYVDLGGIGEYTKFVFIAVYMFAFYFALRCVRAKADFRWLKA